jgi:outer membrane murein-binding lipoprotein Lpp
VTKTAIILAILTLPFILLGCGSDSVSEARVAKLEQRVATLESANEKLRQDVDDLDASKLALRLNFKALDNRTWANDQALYTGLGKAQYDIQCGPNPQGPPGAGGCHVPLGLPGAVYTNDTPRRIFATPLGTP